MRLTKFASALGPLRNGHPRVVEQGRTKAAEKNGKMAGSLRMEGGGARAERDKGSRGERERERGRGEEARGRKILPGVTNALPRGGEVSSMFMPWFTGLPIVPNGPRPRLLPPRPHPSLPPSPLPSPRKSPPRQPVALCRLHLPPPLYLSTYIFRSLQDRPNLNWKRRRSCAGRKP